MDIIFAVSLFTFPSGNSPPNVSRSRNACKCSAVTVFSLRSAIGCFLDTSDCTKIIFHCTVAECPSFQFFFCPHIQKFPYGKIICLCNKLLIFVVFQCLAEKLFPSHFYFRFRRILSEPFYRLHLLHRNDSTNFFAFFCLTDPFAIIVCLLSISDNRNC